MNLQFQPSDLPFKKTLEVIFALEATRRAALLVRRVQAELVSPALSKDDRSPVTVADFASQALVGSLLARAFPQDALVAEEDSRALREPGAHTTLEQVRYFTSQFIPAITSNQVCQAIDFNRADTGERFWTLDPIDGTKGFLRGDQYAIALALVVDGQVQIGALGCPNLVEGYKPDPSGPGSLVLAVRGQGSWTTSLDKPGSFARLTVSNIEESSQARLLRSFESGHTNVSQIDVFAQRMRVASKPVRMDSQAKYAVLAAGEGDLLLRLLSPDQPDYKEKIWDQAAGSIILEEAGGKITDLDGKPLDFTCGRSLTHNRGILASNKALHSAALQTLLEIGA